MKKLFIKILTLSFFFIASNLELNAQYDTLSTFLGHKIILDKNKKLLPRVVPAANPYDYLLKQRWNFVKNAPMSPGPEPRSNFPQYYFYCAWVDSANVMLPDNWMSDVGERIPNWFESARLYYVYTGDLEPLNITKGLVDYSLKHGTSPASFAWPNFPYTTSNAGQLEYTGFTSAKRFSEHDVQVDHAGDMGATYYRMYLFYKDEKYKKAAIDVANILAQKVTPGDEKKSPWPYVVNMQSGKTVSEYGTNWFGCVKLFKMLIDSNLGNVKSYKYALNLVQNWLLKYPIKNGIWVDGHTDTFFTGRDNLSNMSASNAGLYLYDYPEFDPESNKTLPNLIKWTEDNFVNKCQPGEPATFFGANIVGEQVMFMPKMDYQTARYAAQCARWYAQSGDEVYKEKAFRSLNFVTYCSNNQGKTFESPFSKGVNTWWSDSYGESPRMLYHIFAAIPEWAPSGENHILYSDGILSNISYSPKSIHYVANQKSGIEYLKLNFRPNLISLNGKKMALNADANKVGYSLKKLRDGDFALNINRAQAGKVVVMSK